MHHDSSPILLVCGNLYHLGESINERVLFRVPIIITKCQIGIASDRSRNDLEFEVLRHRPVAGLEGDVAVQVVGVLHVRIHGVGPDPEVLRVAVHVHHVLDVALEPRGNVVRLAQECSIKHGLSTACLEIPSSKVTHG